MVVISRGHKYRKPRILRPVAEDARILFGRRLRELRKQAGLSQEALAHESGLDRSYVGGVERGEYNISLLNICLLAGALGLSPDELLKFSNNSKERKARPRGR
jgi:transcriptional regulator with XRE-family HTH domain